MFYEGDLQSGIAKALEESKAVVCFVSDDGEQSSQWENEWLREEELSNTLARQAVVLRLVADSQEAGFLAFFCPITEYPTVLVINQGQLVDQIKPGINATEFNTRLARAVSGNASSDQSQSQVSQSNVNSFPNMPSEEAINAQSPAVEAQDLRPPAPEQPLAPPPTPVPQAQPPQSVPGPATTATQDMWAERRAKLEAQRKAREAEEKAKLSAANARQNPDKGKQPERAEAAEASSSSASSSRVSYMQQQTQRKREAKAERERILKLLENDKVERKRREDERRAAVQAERMEAAEAEQEATTQMSEADVRPITAASGGDRCAVQVRLFDGGTLRSIFPSDATLTSAVRPWIDQVRTDGDSPYTFKQILTPLPSRSLTESEEVATLRDIGLAPSATLILVPVPKFASILGGRAGGRDSPLAGYAMAMIASVLNTLYSFLGMVSMPARENAPEEEAAASTSAVGGNQAQAEQSEAKTTALPGTSNIRIRTLRDQRGGDREDSQLYNGNQLNFEPRKDGDGEEGT